MLKMLQINLSLSLNSILNLLYERFLFNLNELSETFFILKFKTLSIVENGSLGGLKSPKTESGGCEDVSKRPEEI